LASQPSLSRFENTTRFASLKPLAGGAELPLGAARNHDLDG
jgi:hypothetical protein